MKDRTLTVDPCVTLEYCMPNSDYWVHHSAHDDTKQATRVRAMCCADPRERSARTRWRIVQWAGKVTSVLPAAAA